MNPTAMTKPTMLTSRRVRALLSALVGGLLITGCAGNLTGLSGAREDFACPMSGGVNCTTVSDTYEREHAKRENAEAKTLTAPTPQAVVPTAAPLTMTETEGAVRITAERLGADGLHQASARNRAAATRPAALPGRSPERVVMLWVLPWVDTEGDLHSQSRVWMRVRDALWRIESLRRRAMSEAPETTP